MMKRLERYEDIWQLWGNGPSFPQTRRVHFLDIDRIRPVIRYAHEAFATPGSGRIIFDFCLLLFPESSGRLVFEDFEVGLGPRSLVLVPPFASHKFVFDPGISLRHIAVHLDLAPDFPDPGNTYERQPYEVCLRENLSLPVSAHLPSANNVYDSLKAMLAIWQEGTSISRLQADERLFQTITLAITLGQASANRITQPSATTRARSAVASVIAHFQAHLTEHLSPDQMAQLVDMSASHLARCFRQVTGYSPGVYLTRMRIEKARQLLLDNALTVKQIANMVGYDDPRQFSISFHKFDGLSPTQYRQAFPPRDALKQPQA